MGDLLDQNNSTYGFASGIHVQHLIIFLFTANTSLEDVKPCLFAEGRKKLQYKKMGKIIKAKKIVQPFT